MDCVIESDYCLPLVAPGSALNEMITFENINNFKINSIIEAPS